MEMISGSGISRAERLFPERRIFPALFSYSISLCVVIE